MGWANGSDVDKNGKQV